MKLDIQTNIIKTSKNTSISICHFSDIHFSIKYKTSILEKIFIEIQKQKPNYICITGDLIDDTSILDNPIIEILYQFIEKLGQLAPTLIVLGNHDFTNYIHKQKKQEYQFPPTYVERLKKVSNIHLLNNTIYRDDYIQCIGFIPSYELYKKEIKQEKNFVKEIVKIFPSHISDDRYNILLTHSPILISQKQIQKQIYFLQKIDIILCGHTHSGLVPPFLAKIVKGNRGLIAPNKNLFPKNTRGILLQKPIIIINGAIIKLSRSAGILRHFNFLFPSSLNHIKIIEKNE